MEHVFITQKVEVIEEDLRTGKREIYYSRVEDVKGERIWITSPYRRGFNLPPHLGRSLTIKVPGDNCAYLFQAELRRVENNVIALWEIQPSSEAKRVQVREYVRVNIAIKARIEVTDGPDAGKKLTTLTRDLSAGGMRVALPHALFEGSSAGVLLLIPGHQAIALKGKVLRVIAPETENDKMTGVLEFVDVDERVRKHIIRYLFHKQAERRKKDKELFEE